MPVRHKRDGSRSGSALLASCGKIRPLASARNRALTVIVISSALHGNSPAFREPKGIPENCGVEHLDASRPCAIEQLSVESPPIDKHALRLWIGPFANLPIPIHQDRLYRQRAGFLQDVTYADRLEKQTHAWCQGFAKVSPGKLRSLDKDDAMAQGGQLGGKRAARGSTPNNADVCFDRLHEGLERERFALCGRSIVVFSLG